MAIHFDYPLHDEFVLDHGEVVQYFSASKCPCSFVNDANRTRLNCPVCHGTGYNYANPVPVVAIVTGISNQKQLLDSGIAVPGDMVFGLPPDQQILLADWDVVNLSWTNGQPYEGDLIKRGDNGVNNPDLLTYTPTQILSIYSLNPQTFVRTDYQQGIDFTVSGRLLTWASLATPTPGTIYSVKYNAIFDWVVFVTPMDRRENDTQIGQRGLLRKRHIALKTV